MTRYKTLAEKERETAKGKRRRVNGRMDASGPVKSVKGYDFVFSDDINDWRSKAVKNAKPLF